MSDINSVLILVLIMLILGCSMIGNKIKQFAKLCRIEHRRKQLVKHGYVEIPYGFNPSKNEYNYGFKKGNKIISAVEIMTFDNGRFRKYLSKTE